LFFRVPYFHHEGTKTQSFSFNFSLFPFCFLLCVLCVFVAIILIGYTPGKGLTKTEQKQWVCKNFLPSFEPLLALVIIWDTRRKIFDLGSVFLQRDGFSSKPPCFRQNCRPIYAAAGSET
jgi:hypothetical protein